MKCPKCGKNNREGTWHCDCGYDFLSYDRKSSASKHSESKKEITTIPNQESTTAAIQILRFFAWLDLIAGIIGSIPISITYGIIFGLAVLLQGVLCFAFFIVVTQIAENVITIKVNLFHKQSAG